MDENFKFKISGRIIRLGNAITRYRNMQAADADLTSTQSDAIRYIIKNQDKELTAKNLMDYLKLSQSTVAGVIDRLCDKGFIDRKKHAKDSRKIVLVLSDKGRELDGQLYQIGQETERLLLEGMTAEEIAEFNRLLLIAMSNMNMERYAENGQ
ncbi:MAG: MarR family transcriptional regulator [Lachnospiraceae bacterium]|nr:MarR family transcriptional regulator [Lachnospiraceae bacterium]